MPRVKMGQLSNYPIDKERLEKLMNAQGWTRSKLSLALTDGTNSSYVSSLFKDDRWSGRVGSVKLEKLCRILQSKPEYLCHAPEEQEKEDDPVDISLGYLTMEFKCEMERQRDQLGKIADLIQRQCRLSEELLHEWKGGKA